MMMCRVVRFVNVMDQYQFLETVKQEEADNQCDHRPGTVERVVASQFKDRRQDVEAHDAHQHSRGKTKYVMESIAIAQSEQPAGASRDEGCERQEKRVRVDSERSLHRSMISAFIR